MKIRLTTGTGKRLLIKAQDSAMSELDIEVKAEDSADLISRLETKIEKLKSASATAIFKADILKLLKEAKAKGATENDAFIEKFSKEDSSNKVYRTSAVAELKKALKFLETNKAEDMALSKQRLQFLQPSTMEEVVELMKRYLRRDIPVMLVGSSGFGKSELIRQAATNIPGFPVPASNILDIRAGMLNVEDLRGLPMLVKSDDFEKSFTQSTVPTWLKKVILHPNENFVLFFDELNHASAAVLNSVYGIILERTLEDFKFAERTRIVAAGNKADQNEDLTELSDPLLRRLEVIDIDKAIDIDTSFYERYLINKYKDAIPDEILKLVFDPETTTADARSVERVLKAWKDDIQDGEAILTKSGAIPMDLFARIQKIYSQKYYKPTGSERHKSLIDQIIDYAKKLKTEHPEFYTVPTSVGFRVKDLINGELKPVPYEGSETTISPEGIQHIKDHFNNEPEEFVVAALSKLNK